MVFQEIDPVKEIDKELIMFKQLVLNCNKNTISLLIGQGGAIAQHFVEYLARNEDELANYTYNYYFEDFINECKFLPDHIRDYVLFLQKHRYDAFNLKYEDDFDEIFFSYLESYIQFLFLFRNFIHTKCRDLARFNELNSTLSFLQSYIALEKEKRKLTNPQGPILEETRTPPDLNETLNKFDSKLDTILSNQESDKKHHENHTNQLNNLTNTVNDIDKKTDQILIEFRNLNEKIDKYRKDNKISTKFDNAQTEEEKDKIMWGFAEKCGKIMRDYTNEYINTHDYKKEEENLIDSLGKPAWNKLSRKSKTFLTTSKFTYNNLKSLGDIIDYSGVCVLVTKALEAELCKRFYKGFGKYLFKEYEKNYSEYHTSLVGYNKYTKDHYRLTDNKDCDLGRITCILGFNRWGMSDEEYEHNILRSVEYSRKYFKNYSDDKIKETLIEYGSYVDEIRRKYRNRAAHTNELSQTNARECFRYVLDVEQVLKIMLDSFEE